MARKGVVISNCQCAPLANALGNTCYDMVFEPFGVHILPQDQREAAIGALVDRARDEFDVIIAIPLSDEWGRLSASRIRDSFAGTPVIMVSNIYFSGFHPDLTYIGGLAQRVAGPLGDYHSRLALFGFLRGLGIEDTVRLFRDETYEAAGYYAEYERSLAELRQRDVAVDYRVTDILEDAMHRDLCFFSVNHPTAALFAPFAHLIVQGLAQRGLCRQADMPASAMLCENSLFSSVVFPVYPEVARRHGVPHIGSYAFKPEGWQANPLDLGGFVAAEFAAFEAAGQAALARTALAAELLKTFAAAVP